MFFIRRCNSYAEQKYNVTCNSDEQINKKYSTLWIDTYVQQKLIDPGDKDEPIEQAFIFESKQFDYTNKNILR